MNLVTAILYVRHLPVTGEDYVNVLVKQIT